MLSTRLNFMKMLILTLSTFVGAVSVFVLSFLTSNEELRVASLIISCFLLVVASLLNVLYLIKKKNSKIRLLEKKLDVWNDTSYRINQAGNEVFNDLPIGIMVYDNDFNIKWSNGYVKQLFKSNLNDINIMDIDNNLYSIVKEKTEVSTIVIGSSYFDIKNSFDAKIIYLFDETSREELTKRYNDNVNCIGIISIDNLDISLRKLDMQEQNNVRGQILGEISDYISNYNVFIQSYTNEQLVMFFNKASLDKMVVDKFSILDNIRELASSSHLKTSVSLGIACFDVSSEELGRLAQSAVDLAIKRGGDQVVVNVEGEKIQFFGGKSNALEKNSLLESRIQYQNLIEMIEKSSNVVVTTHNNADCDAFASSVAMCSIVSSLNKDVSFLFDLNKADNTVKKLYSIIESSGFDFKNIVVDDNKVEIKDTTLIILLDTQSEKLSMYPQIIENASNLYVIDHHRHGDESFNNAQFVYVETSSSSTTELVVDMFVFFDKLKINTTIATSLLVGIVVDTNNFMYRTGIRTFEVAATLKSLGGDMISVREILREDIALEQEIANAILNAEVILNKIAIVKLSDDKLNYQRQILPKISDKLLEIEGIEASFTIGHTDDLSTTAISARSYDNINVQLVMEELGGGGHLNSAACKLVDTSISESYNILVDIIKREYDNGDEKMKVILTADVKGKGKKSSIIEVANGYANYLFTNNLAKPATKENIDELASMEQEKKAAEDSQKQMMLMLKDEVEQKSINMYIKIGNDGKSFGQITTKQICDEFESQRGIKLDKRKVSLASDINSVGIYTAKVDLHKEVVASIEINVLEK